MDPLLLATIIRGVQAGVGVIVAMRGGDNAGALDIVEGYLARPGSRLDPEIFDVVKMAAAGLQFLNTRGISQEDAIALLRNADAEGRDLTDEEVDDFLAGTQVVADRVEDLVAALEAEEAAAGSSTPEPDPVPVDDSPAGEADSGQPANP